MSQAEGTGAVRHAVAVVLTFITLGLGETGSGWAIAPRFGQGGVHATAAVTASVHVYDDPAQHAGARRASPVTAVNLRAPGRQQQHVNGDVVAVVATRVAAEAGGAGERAIVMGEDMEGRVIPKARELGADIYDPPAAPESEWMDNNRSRLVAGAPTAVWGSSGESALALGSRLPVRRPRDGPYAGVARGGMNAYYDVPYSYDLPVQLSTPHVLFPAVRGWPAGAEAVSHMTSLAAFT
jgi:hypothetical protein